MTGLTTTMLRTGRSITALVMVLAALWPRILPAAPPAASEQAVKAAYVFNFIKFTDWPEAAFVDSTATLVLCTDAEGDMREALDALRGRSAKGLTVDIRDLPDAGLGGCHVALVEEDINLPRLAGADAVLTIHSSEHDSGIIRLFRDGRRLRFDIDLGLAQRHGIRLSAKLLGVAANVSDAPAGD